MVPAAWAGAVASMMVALVTVKVVASTEPNQTAVAPVKSVPVISTAVPPAVVPVLTSRLVMTGSGAAV